MKRYLPFVAAAVLVAWCATPAQAQISIPTDTPYLQDFDSIGTATSWTMPAGWRMANATIKGYGVREAINWIDGDSAIAAGTGAGQIGGNNVGISAANGLYNFGAGLAGEATDRALGSIASGTGTKSSGVMAFLTNNTGDDLGSLTITYNVEKYRHGSNAAGWEIQMWYSADGENWTSAGSNFRTAFPADADNTGFAEAPGATVAVSASLPVSIPNGTNIYLQWVQSVVSGTTTTNSQGLGLDDVTVLGVLATDDFIVTGSSVNFGTNLDIADGPFSQDITINAAAAVTVNAPGSLPAGISVTPASLVFAEAGSDTFTITWTPAANDGTVLDETLTFTSNGEPASFDVTLSGSTLIETTIAALRTAYETDSAATVGKAYRVTGIVSSNNLGAANRNTLSLQDRVDGDAATRGISIDDSAATGKGAGNLPEIGDQVTVTGAVGNFGGLVQLTPDRAYSVTPDAAAAITPVEIVSTDLGDDTESVLLVLGDATSASVQTLSKNTSLTLNDGTDFLVRAENNPNFDTFSYDFNMSDVYVITGVGGQYQGGNPVSGGSGYQIRPRTLGDISVDTASVADWMMFD